MEKDIPFGILKSRRYIELSAVAKAQLVRAVILNSSNNTGMSFGHFPLRGIEIYVWFVACMFVTIPKPLQQKYDTWYWDVLNTLSNGGPPCVMVIGTETVLV